MSSRLQAAGAGAAAATVWGLLEQVDQRLLRCDYSDIAVLGKAVTRGQHWRLTGFMLHAANGAVFGLGFDELRRRVRVNPRRLAAGPRTRRAPHALSALLLRRPVPPGARRAGGSAAAPESPRLRPGDVAPRGLRHGSRQARRLTAGRREVLVVRRTCPAPTPRPADGVERTHEQPAGHRHSGAHPGAVQVGAPATRVHGQADARGVSLPSPSWSRCSAGCDRRASR